MPDAFEEQAVLVAAEQAAAEGDTIAAEGHLRTLLELQTARLGPEHAEVASTLHNLAVVCERAGRLGDAEGLYRKAFAVASVALPAHDSLVVRCRDDLNAFLEARMMPPVPPPGPPAPPAAARVTPTSGVRTPSPSSPSRPPSSQTPARAPARPASRVRTPLPPQPLPASPTPWIARIAVAAVVVALVVAWAVWRREPAAPAPAPTAPVAAPAAKRIPPAKKAAATPAKATAPPTPAPTTGAVSAGETTPQATTTSAAKSSAAAEAAGSTAAATSGANGGATTITDARLCRELSTSGAWTCVPVEQPVAPGRLFFLTRLDVPATTEVSHRWYRGEEVVRSVSLRIPAAGRPGYRSYSRLTIDPGRSGPWRVELRSADGAVLAVERFTVQ